jgi:hypothetical protein
VALKVFCRFLLLEFLILAEKGVQCLNLMRIKLRIMDIDILTERMGKKCTFEKEVPTNCKYDFHK